MNTLIPEIVLGYIKSKTQSESSSTTETPYLNYKGLSATTRDSSLHYYMTRGFYNTSYIGGNNTDGMERRSPITPTI